jgi:hypothetical protein
VKSAGITVRHLIAAATLLAASVAANAASTVTFNNVANSVDRGGVYAGFYELTLDAQALLGLCDSVNAQINPPITWTADILTYADIQAGGVGKFNSPSTAATLAKYSQAGWLFSQIGTLAVNDYAGQADIQEAIWKIMVPGYALVGAGAGAWFTSATDTTHDAFDWSAVMRVVTPNPLNQQTVDVQEFLIGPDPTVVPVPAAAWLFASAIGLMGLARRRAD